MADVYDLTMAIAAAINTAVQPLVGTEITLYPAIDNTTFGPEEVCPSILVMGGNALLKDLMYRLEQGKTVIQVEPDEANIPTRQYMAYDTFDTLTSTVAPLLAFSLSNNSKAVTLSGSIQAGDVIGVSILTIGAAYEVQATDTLSSVATNFAAAINATAGMAATVSGLTVTITTPGTCTFAVGAQDNTRLIETMRRRKVFFATLYATTPYIRSYIGKVLENVFPMATRLQLEDGTYATMIGPMVSHDFDEQQRDTTLMRRVWWTFDFLTTQVLSTTQVVAALETAQVAYSGITPSPPTASQL